MGEISAPQPLSLKHDLSAFNSGEATLDDWLRRWALRNEDSGASRTYVVCEGTVIIGYYSLAVGAVVNSQAPGRIRRNMPDPIPVMLLGRLAVNKRHQGLGLGTGLLRDAVMRTVQASEIAGIRAIMVHAISPTAKRFYENYGFVPSAIDPMMLLIAIADAAKMLQSPKPL